MNLPWATSLHFIAKKEPRTIKKFNQMKKFPKQPVNQKFNLCLRRLIKHNYHCVFPKLFDCFRHCLMFHKKWIAQKILANVLFFFI